MSLFLLELVTSNMSSDQIWGLYLVQSAHSSYFSRTLPTRRMVVRIVEPLCEYTCVFFVVRTALCAYK